MSPRLRAFLLVLLVLCVSSQLVAAWGVNPGRQRALFTQDQQQLSVTIENPERLEGYFRVEFEGSLSPYAHYTTKLVYLDDATASVSVPFTLKLPPSLPPGTNKLRVKFRQVPGDASSGTVGSLITLVADVDVDVPLNGNHITAQLSVGQAPASQPTPITVSVVNKGEGDVAVWADVVVRGPTNKELASWSTDRQVIAFQGVGKIVTSWAAEKEPGEYALEVSVHYDDQVIALRDGFLVGSKEVVSESIGSSRFSLGGIVPVEITVRNRWNQLVRGVFADVYVLSEEGDILQSFKTASEDVGALSRGVLTGYWDTAGLVVGSYAVNVVVSYDGEQSQQSYPVVVKMGELEVQRVTGEVVGGESGGSQYSLLILLVAVLLVTNVIIIIYFRRLKRS